MTTYGDWFSGFGGMTIGAKEAGLEVVFGAEYDPKIAAVYRQNLGDHVMVCDLLETPVTAFPRVDVFHASPPCPNFSNAKANAEETERDIDLSAKVAEYIVYHLPDIFTLENVYQYRNSKSWLTIAQALHNHGYLFNYWHCNFADWGVAQTRQRMIVIARRDGVMPQLPPATHTEEPMPGLFGTLKRWISWYDAIEDLIPGLPDSKLPNFYAVQGVILPLSIHLLKDNDGGNNGKRYRDKGEPVFTVTAAGGFRVFNGSDYRDDSPAILARFQSFPQWYIMPDDNETARRGIGNAVPPLFAEKLYRHLVPDAVKV